MIQSSNGRCAIQTGIDLLKILLSFYLVISVKLVADGILRGSEMMSRFMAFTFTDLILRVTLDLLLSQTFSGATGIWCSWLVGWTVVTFMSVYLYYSGLCNGRKESCKQGDSFFGRT